jgi:phage tail-like protein
MPYAQEKTAAEIKSAYPIPVYNYQVKIGTEAYSFRKVSGLEISFETSTYKESAKSGPGPVWYQMPAQPTALKISLERGMVESNARQLYDWINGTALNAVEKKDITVSLLDEAGNPRVTWLVRNAFPVKLKAPDFDANSNDVAIESMELVADSVSIL